MPTLELRFSYQDKIGWQVSDGNGQLIACYQSRGKAENRFVWQLNKLMKGNPDFSLRAKWENSQSEKETMLTQKSKVRRNEK